MLGLTLGGTYRNITTTDGKPLDPKKPTKTEPKKPDPTEPKPKDDPEKHTLNIDGTFTIDGQDFPIQIENIEFDSDGKIIPMQGTSDLGPYLTTGTMDFENKVLQIERKFDNGMILSGIGVVDPKNNFTKGTWKLENVDSHLKNDIFKLSGLSLSSGPKIIGSWRANSNASSVYSWHSSQIKSLLTEYLASLVDPKAPKLSSPTKPPKVTTKDLHWHLIADEPDTHLLPPNQKKKKCRHEQSHFSRPKP